MRKLREIVVKNYRFISPNISLRSLCQGYIEQPHKYPLFQLQDGYFIVTPLDIVRTLAQIEDDISTLTARDLAREMLAVEIETSVRQVARLMFEHDLDRLLVLRENRVWGTVAASSVAKEILRLEIGRRVHQEIQQRNLESTSGVKGGLSQAALEETLRDQIEAEIEQKLLSQLNTTFDSMFGLEMDDTDSAPDAEVEDLDLSALLPDRFYPGRAGGVIDHDPQSGSDAVEGEEEGMRAGAGQTDPVDADLMPPYARAATKMPVMTPSAVFKALIGTESIGDEPQVDREVETGPEQVAAAPGRSDRARPETERGVVTDQQVEHRGEAAVATAHSASWSELAGAAHDESGGDAVGDADIDGDGEASALRSAAATVEPQGAHAIEVGTGPPLVEQFIRDHDEPLEDIELLYHRIERLGFDLSDKQRSYLRHLVFKKAKSLDRKLANLKATIGPEPASPMKHDHGSKAAPSAGVSTTPPAAAPVTVAKYPHPSRVQASRSRLSSGGRTAGWKPRRLGRSATRVKTTPTSHIAVVYTEQHSAHISSQKSPENPDRIKSIMNLLQGRVNVFERNCELVSDFDDATPEEVLRVHTPRHLEFVESYSARGGGFLGDSTYMTTATYQAALRAAGGALAAADTVLKKKADYALALVRPPGHHATEDSYGGYCIFNNAAILARALQTHQRFRRIMIIDWDAHAGNGTMKIFYNDPTVLYVSMHQDPSDFYPNTGFADQIGTGSGRGYTVNIPMPKGAGDDDYRLVMDEIVIPLVMSYAPHFIIGCNGFDAHYKEPTAKLQLTSAGYHYIVDVLKDHLRGKSAILMEGGYHRMNGKLTLTLLDALSELPNPFPKDASGPVTDAMRREATATRTQALVRKTKQMLAQFYYGF